MGLKILRYRIGHGSTRRHAIFRALIIASALSVVPLMEVMYGTEVASKNDVGNDYSAVDLGVVGEFLFSGPKLFLDRLLEPLWGRFETEKPLEIATGDIVTELMGLKLLHYDAKVLCIGRRSDLAVSAFKELGFSDAHGVLRHPLFSFMHKKHVYELGFTESSLDFVFCGDLDMVVSPALLVLEMERVLKPGGIGAVLVNANGGSYLNGLVKSATSVSSWLKESVIAHVNYLGEFSLVVFKKNETDSYFGDKNQLPSDCGSVVNNKPYIGFMEPLVLQKPEDFPRSITYLPKLIDVSLKKRLVYIDIGAAAHMDSNFSSSWFLQSYPVDSKAFNIYYVDHNTSVMISYVKKPGVTFVYYPGLASDNKATAKNIHPHEHLDPFPEDEGFDFLAWFQETVKYADFVVLKMNTSEVEIKFLSGLLESGAICSVDELFLRCSNETGCLRMHRALRNRGVFVHQWWGD